MKTIGFIGLGKEYWKKIPGFDSYSISNRARVRRDAPAPGCKAGHILKPHLTNKGYFRVRLSLGSRDNFVRPSVHSLMATTFIGDRPHGFDINHKDGNRINNSIDNLEYVTRSQNCLDGFKRGRVSIPPKHSGSSHPQAKIDEPIARSIKTMLKSGMSAIEVARNSGISKYIIYDIKRGKTWTSV
ncbi:MAG TPA: NUMOD4 motif-containing HNH endonuclease [Candidatus Saccharibacteria bacterium]|nr:NUMOD4 motif-containing HNH endonuclease [Candidatus Saccharibacteria bacterium]